MGFKSGLSGGVKIVQKPGKPLGIFGKISVENGRYRSMGQNLLVETGEVRFSGTPDSGLINVQAIRNPTTIDDDVKAGIKVYGPIQKPKVSVFSEPELDESEALSYILRGHGTDGESDTGSLAKSMMISAGLSLVGGSVTGMLETFGVRDVELDTTGKDDNTKVSISGYVAPRLRVQYGIGIFDSASEVSVRYDLARDLYVRFVSGLSQAADLVYTLEFD
jgi:translocation and assembly module TamB